MKEDKETSFINKLMGCACDAPISPIDTYFYDGQIRVVFQCLDCGKMVMIESPIKKIYDCRFYKKQRQM